MNDWYPQQDSTKAIVSKSRQWQEALALLPLPEASQSIFIHNNQALRLLCTLYKSLTPAEPMMKVYEYEMAN